MSDNSFEIICNSCRAAVPFDAEVCPECGAVLIARPDRPPPPPRATTAASQAAPPRPTALTGAELAAAYRRAAADHEPSVSAVSYAGFWVRVVASFIDGALILGTTVGVFVAGFEAVAGLLYIGAHVLYYPLMEGSSLQGTIGKLVCGVAVTDLEGRRISFPRAYLRFVGRFVVSLTGGLGYLFVIFMPRKQGLHDLIAKTLVLNRGSY